MDDFTRRGRPVHHLLVEGAFASSDPKLIVVNLPEALYHTAEYGFVLSPAAGQKARLFSQFLLAQTAKSILLKHGFDDK